MIINGQISPQRLQREFKKMTRLSIQVRGPQTITISREQGEASNANDGIQLTQATTAPPYDFWWVGELWYTSSIANGDFVLLIIGEAS